MPRGKKTSPEVIYAVMASWFITGNLKETSDVLGMAVSTVKGIVDKNKDNPEFEKLRNEKKDEFSEKASIIIDKGMLLMERRLDRAIEQESALDELIGEIYSADKEEISSEEKKSLAAKLRALQIQDIKALTTAIGTLYDKRALADGKPTGRTELVGDDKLSKLAELAGYERKQ